MRCLRRAKGRGGAAGAFGVAEPFDSGFEEFSKGGVGFADQVLSFAADGRRQSQKPNLPTGQTVENFFVCGRHSGLLGQGSARVSISTQIIFLLGSSTSGIPPTNSESLGLWTYLTV